MSRTRPEERKGKPVKAGEVEFDAVSLATIFDENRKDKMVARNSASVKSKDVMSVELQEGMVIRAENTINTREDEGLSI